MFQRFRLANSAERVVAEDVFDQKVDAFECSAILSLPVAVVLPPPPVVQARLRSLTCQVVLRDAASSGALDGIDQAARVLGRAEQVGGFHEGVVLVFRHQHGRAALRCDLDLSLVEVDTFDESEQLASRFACRDSHDSSESYQILYD